MPRPPRPPRIFRTSDGSITIDLEKIIAITFFDDGRLTVYIGGCQPVDVEFEAGEEGVADELANAWGDYTQVRP